jgi:cyclase
MTVLPRLIPILQIEGSAAVKTSAFTNPRYIGSALNSLRMFSELEVDELVVIDLTNDVDRNSRDHVMFLEEFSSEGFMPMTYGGRVRNLERAVELTRLGFEKIILGTATYESPALIDAVADKLGAQAVVAAVDVWSELGEHFVCSDSGRNRIQTTVEGRLEQLSNKPVGEILLTSVNREGQRCGLDLDLISQVVRLTEVPLVASGGVSSITDCVAALHAGASAVAIGDTAVCLGGSMGTLIHLPGSSYRDRWFEESN